MSTRTRTFTEIVAAYPPGVQTLARQTRQRVRALVPGAEETGDARGPFIAYGYGPGYAGIVATISVSRTGVKLALAHGASLPDPDGLLRGAGKVHRHIVITSADDLRRSAVETLVRAALAAWRARRE